MTQPIRISSDRAGTEGPSCGGAVAAGRIARVASWLLLAVFAAACGEFSGSSSSGGGGGGAGGLGGPGAGTSGASEAEMMAAFDQTAYPLTSQYCNSCHAGAGPGTPHISHPDLTSAYHAVVDNNKVSLSSPQASRLVQRLVTDFHNCWSDCASDGAQMQAAIEQWAQLVDFSGGGTNVDGIVSTPLTFADGVEEEGQARYTRNLIGLWEFKEESGQVALDTSGVDPPMDLTLDGPQLMSSYGIQIDEGKAFATREASRKLYDHIADPNQGTQQYSVEAWVVPDNTDQEGPARIVTYSSGTGQRNFTLGQVLYYYNFRNRSLNPELGVNGTPALQTSDADEDLQATLHHVVITYDQYRGRRVYVDGDFTDDVDEFAPARLWNWDPEFQFVLGNETSDNRQWVGQLRLVAIYEHALTEAQIQQNYDAGVGKRLVFRFDLTQWIGPGAYIEFVVVEFDQFAYLFCQPRLVTNGLTGFRVANLRVAINGQIPLAGQAFRTLDTLVSEPNQLLSDQCSVVQKDLGPATDVFTIQFEYLGDFADPVVVPPPPPPTVALGASLPIEGLRSFERINETMSSLTGVDANTQNVRDQFIDLTQQLPSTYDIRTFASAQQVAIAKLGLEYCDALVESPGLRDAFFGTAPAFEFDQPVPTAFSDPAKRDIVIDALYDRMYGVNIANQPSLAEVRPELDALVDQLIAGCDAATCAADRTRTVVKGVCAAVLTSAAVTVH